MAADGRLLLMAIPPRREISSRGAASRRESVVPRASLEKSDLFIKNNNEDFCYPKIKDSLIEYNSVLSRSTLHYLIAHFFSFNWTFTTRINSLTLTGNFF